MIRQLITAMGVVFLVVVSSQAAQVLVPGPEGDCGFSKLKTTRPSHFTEVTRVEPQYPPAAKAAGVTGTVQVWVLINKDGLVEKTCPSYIDGEPEPDRSLVISAEAAALQWRFHKNFGFSSADGLRFDYIEKGLVFNFVLGKSADE